MTVPQLPGESGSTVNAGMFARDVTVTDRRVHLPTAALVIAEEAQMLSEYHQSIAEQARVVRETEMRHRQQILSEEHELERRFASGQTMDRQALTRQLEGMQSFYAGQSQEQIEHVQRIMTSEVNGYRACEQVLKDRHQYTVELGRLQGIVRQEKGEASHQVQGVRKEAMRIEAT